jgi:hypothetical protein
VNQGLEDSPGCGTTGSSCCQLCGDRRRTSLGEEIGMLHFYKIHSLQFSVIKKTLSSQCAERKAGNGPTTAGEYTELNDRPDHKTVELCPLPENLDDNSTKEEKTAENSRVSDQLERRNATEIGAPPVPSPLGSESSTGEAAEASCPLSACLGGQSPVREATEASCPASLGSKSRVEEAAEASCPPVPEPLGSQSRIEEAAEASCPPGPSPLGSKSRVEEAAEASCPPVPSPLGSKSRIEEAAEASCPPVPSPLGSQSRIEEAAEASCPPGPSPLGSKSRIEEAAEASCTPGPSPLGSKSRVEEAAEASCPPGPSPLGSQSRIEEAAEASCPPVPEPLGSQSRVEEAAEASCPPVLEPLGRQSPEREAAEASCPPVHEPLGSKSRVEEGSGPPGKEEDGTGQPHTACDKCNYVTFCKECLPRHRYLHYTLILYSKLYNTCCRVCKRYFSYFNFDHAPQITIVAIIYSWFPFIQMYEYMHVLFIQILLLGCDACLSRLCLMTCTKYRKYVTCYHWQRLIIVNFWR